MNVDTQKLGEDLSALLDDLAYPVVSRTLLVMVLTVLATINLMFLGANADLFTDHEIMVLNVAMELVGFALVCYVCLPLLKYGRQHWKSIFGKLTFGIGAVVSAYALMEYFLALIQV